MENFSIPYTNHEPLTEGVNDDIVIKVELEPSLDEKQIRWHSLDLTTTDIVQ